MNQREYPQFGFMNMEAVRLIAKLGAAKETTLRCALEDAVQKRLTGRWSKYQLISAIVGNVEYGNDRAIDALIHHGLWAGAKRTRAP